MYPLAQLLLDTQAKCTVEEQTKLMNYKTVLSCIPYTKELLQLIPLYHLIKNEFEDARPGTSGSEFFITTVPTP